MKNNKGYVLGHLCRLLCKEIKGPICAIPFFIGKMSLCILNYFTLYIGRFYYELKFFTNVTYDTYRTYLFFRSNLI